MIIQLLIGVFIGLTIGNLLSVTIGLITMQRAIDRIVSQFNALLIVGILAKFNNL